MALPYLTEHPPLPIGHYICDCHYADGDPDDPTDRWLSYNDHIVTETTGELVCERRQRSSYMLFYERRVRKRQTLDFPHTA